MQDTTITTISTIFSIAALILTLVSNWIIFKKAGEAGWKSIVPIYDAIIFSKIVTGSKVKWLLCLIPVFGFFYALVLEYKLCKSFGHGFGFFLGCLFLSPVFMLILAFGSSKYIGPQ